jgi:hypothetical protein
VVLWLTLNGPRAVGRLVCGVEMLRAWWTLSKTEQRKQGGKQQTKQIQRENTEISTKKVHQLVFPIAGITSPENLS